VMGKNLPYFNGKPGNWPLFVTSYYRTSNLCGFSKNENLTRLTKCLKGEALAAVKGRLLVPQNVPKVMQTLEQMYGIP
jgi:hypothetical protein